MLAFEEGALGILGIESAVRARLLLSTYEAELFSLFSSVVIAVDDDNTGGFSRFRTCFLHSSSIALRSVLSDSFDSVDGDGRHPKEILRERSRDTEEDLRLYLDEASPRTDPPPIDNLELLVILISSIVFPLFSSVTPLFGIIWWCLIYLKMYQCNPGICRCATSQTFEVSLG